METGLAGRGCLALEEEEEEYKEPVSQKTQECCGIDVAVSCLNLIGHVHIPRAHNGTSSYFSMKLTASTCLFFFLVLFSDKKVIGREGGSHLMNRGKTREMDKKGLGGRSDETHMPPCKHINFNYSFFF